MTTTEIESKIRELESLRKQTRLWGWGTTAAITLISFGSVGLLVNAVHNLFQPGPTRDEFAATLTGNLKRDVLPQVQDIAGRTLTESKPEIEAAFTRLNARVPELTGASMQQLDLLRQNIPQRGDKALSATYGAMLKKKEPAIRQMFPEANEANVATLVTTMTAEGQQQITAANDTLFAKHTAALDSIIGDLEKISSTETVTPDDSQANWEMALTVVDSFHDDLQGLRAEGAAPAATTSPASKAAGKEAKK